MTANHFNESRNEDANIEKSKIEDVSSSFYLSALDHLDLNPITHQLDGSNYNSWSRAIAMAFTTMNKMLFVNGTILRPDHCDSIYNF